MKKITFLLTLFLLTSEAAFSAGNILGVLTVKVKGKAPFSVDTALLTDLLMQKAHESGKFNVMTKENVGFMLKDAGKDLGKCGDAECDVDFGRALNADFLLTSQLTFMAQAGLAKRDLIEQ